MQLEKYDTPTLFQAIVGRVNASLVFLDALESGQIRVPVSTHAGVLRAQLAVLRQYDTIRGWFSRQDKQAAGACKDTVFHAKLLHTANLLTHVETAAAARIQALMYSANAWVSKARRAEANGMLEDAEFYYLRALQSLDDLMQYKKPHTAGCAGCAKTITTYNELAEKLYAIRGILAQRMALQVCTSAA
jgi:hypothetical protein